MLYMCTTFIFYALNHSRSAEYEQQAYVNKSHIPLMAKSQFKTTDALTYFELCTVVLFLAFGFLFSVRYRKIYGG